MRRRADSYNLTVNVNVTIGDDGKAKKSIARWKMLAKILAVILSVVVVVTLLLTVPNVDPNQCAKLVRAFISTLLGG